MQRSYRIPERVDMVLHSTAALLSLDQTELLVQLLEKGLRCRR